MIKKYRNKVFLVGILSCVVLFAISQFYLKSDGKNYAAKIKKKILSARVLKHQKDSTRAVNKVSEKVDLLFNQLNINNNFNGSVLIAKHGSVIFSGDYGLADFSKNELLNSKSEYQLASVSKQFTAASIMILVDKELISVDDSVTCYYPKFPYKDATIRHLLTHTAGLPMYFWLAEHKWRSNVPPSNSEMMDLLETENLTPYFWPGRRFDYSNTGYFVLASIVENVSGMPFPDFVTKHIFTPLEMNDSYVYRYSKDSLRKNQLAGYQKRGRNYYSIGGTVNDRIVGDKNVYSTPKDLLKWVNGLNSGEIVSETSLMQMYQKGKTKRGVEVPYGFGFRLTEVEGSKLIYHNGRWNGFSTTIRQYINDDLVIIILEHSSYRKISKIADEVRSIVNEEYHF